MSKCEHDYKLDFKSSIYICAHCGKGRITEPKVGREEADMAALHEAVAALLKVLDGLTTYDERPSNIWLYFYPSATGDYVNLWELKEKAEPAITALRNALAAHGITGEQK